MAGTVGRHIVDRVCRFTNSCEPMIVGCVMNCFVSLDSSVAAPHLLVAREVRGIQVSFHVRCVLRR